MWWSCCMLRFRYHVVNRCRKFPWDLRKLFIGRDISRIWKEKCWGDLTLPCTQLTAAGVSADGWEVEKERVSLIPKGKAPNPLLACPHWQLGVHWSTLLRIASGVIVVLHCSYWTLNPPNHQFCSFSWAHNPIVDLMQPGRVSPAARLKTLTLVFVGGRG